MTGFTPVMSFGRMRNAFATACPVMPPMRWGAGVAGITTTITTTITTATIRPVRSVVFA
ncbi:hypothetical protein NY751_21775 [Xanthomonas campestris]|uniref:hypothetical protein n=1 Tax=Xanthomonas campestris TaxID=339 RepID=UPI0023587640|nr:hypothetical protein [Xanthomonas campestris]MDC8748626.1 hypothetical protein [Xanthomonas campestris]